MAMPKKIVDIQEKREQDALKIFIDKKQIYERAKAQHDAHIQALEEFKLFRITETDRVFAELKANPLAKKELDKKKQGLAELKFKELAMVEEEMKIAMQVKQTEMVKNQAQQNYNASRVKKTKFEEVYKVQQQRILTSQDRKEESDLDEEMVLRFAKENI